MTKLSEKISKIVRQGNEINTAFRPVIANVCVFGFYLLLCSCWIFRGNWDIWDVSLPNAVILRLKSASLSLVANFRYEEWHGTTI